MCQQPILERQELRSRRRSRNCGVRRTTSTIFEAVDTSRPCDHTLVTTSFSRLTYRTSSVASTERELPDAENRRSVTRLRVSGRWPRPYRIRAAIAQLCLTGSCSHSCWRRFAFPRARLGGYCIESTEKTTPQSASTSTILSFQAATPHCW